MINSELPDLHQPLAGLIRSIAPDAEVEIVTSPSDTVRLRFFFAAAGRGISLRHTDEGYWTDGCNVLKTELDLVKCLCRIVGTPRIAGPADVAEMLETERRKLGGQAMIFMVEAQYAAALAMDSAAIFACSRALPNNDWSKHTLAETRAETATPLRAEPLPNGDVVYVPQSSRSAPSERSERVADMLAIVTEFNRGDITKPQAEVLLDTAMPGMPDDERERLLTRTP